MHAEICPLCKGEGKKEPFNLGAGITADRLLPCNGCNGKGWVEVKDDNGTTYVPYYPYPPYPILPYIGTQWWSTQTVTYSGTTTIK